jgi:acyl-CoA thioesterase-2
MTLPERTRAGRPIGGSSADEWAALDIRVVEPEPGQDGLQVWLRTSGALPDDPLVHAAALAYASDLTLLGSAILPNGIAPNDPNVFLASIDHAMWFHQPVRMDRWLLHDQQSPSASGGRGLGRGRVFDLDGTLVATTVQEGLIRLLLPESATGDRTQA